MLKERFNITPKNFPEEESIFANLQETDRSSHLGHALVEYEPSKILAFYPDCSAVSKDHCGHSGDGWMKYKRSFDGGKTWTEAKDEPHSKALYEESNHSESFMIEKAIITDTGRIVLFYLHCDLFREGHLWEPYLPPFYAYSDDNGESYSSLKKFTGYTGRIWDARYKDGVIYVYIQEGEFTAHSNSPYHLYVSEDNGETFTLRSTVGFDSCKDCFYGNIYFLPDGRLIAYSYDETDERNLKYVISEDNGFTWGENRRMFFKKRIRNPQVAFFDGLYFMHGRSGSLGDPDKAGHFVLYTSEDGFNWDDGEIVRYRENNSGAYSNNLIIHDENGNEKALYVQFSHAYHLFKTNVLELLIEKK